MLLVSMLASVSSTRVVARAAEETLASARELYASAAYEDALVILNRLRITANSDDQLPIDQYRAFCLLALGRTQDAVQAIEAVVTARPTYQPADSEVSPRIRSAFTDVRRRLLPGLIESRYATAKAAFDRKEFSTAATGFKQVLEALSDPDVSVAAGKPPLSDIKTLSAGFFDLSTAAAAVVAAAAPPPPPPPVSMPPPAPIPTATPGARCGCASSLDRPARVRHRGSRHRRTCACPSGAAGYYQEAVGRYRSGHQADGASQ
jgi:tetratricopeptide (TPR) repeat protein